MRTGTEGTRSSQVGPQTKNTQIDFTQRGRQPVTSTIISDFKHKTHEIKAKQELSEIASKQRAASGANNQVLIDFHAYYSLYNNLQPPECSNIIYFQVVDQKYDSKETLMNVINNIYH